MSETDAAPGPVEVSVLVDGDHLESIDEVALALAGAGLEVHQTLKVAGVISGSVADPGALAALAEVDGVAAVERGRTIELPPPDEPIQ